MTTKAVARQLPFLFREGHSTTRQATQRRSGRTRHDDGGAACYPLQAHRNAIPGLHERSIEGGEVRRHSFCVAAISDSLKISEEREGLLVRRMEKMAEVLFELSETLERRAAA